ncbi:MAG: hypothetical protein ACRDD7_16350 [Peptostreptococcaceae bacterium]
MIKVTDDYSVWPEHTFTNVLASDGDNIAIEFAKEIDIKMARVQAIKLKEQLEDVINEQSRVVKQ